MTRINWSEYLRKKIGNIVESSPISDVERGLHSLVSRLLNRLDLVTREEFNEKTDLLESTRKHIEEIDIQVQRLGDRLNSLENNSNKNSSK